MMKLTHVCVAMAIGMFASAVLAADKLSGILEPANCDSGEDLGEFGTDYMSDPVYFGNGDFRITETDLFIAGRGMDFAFTRTYRSLTGIQDFKSSLPSPMGNDWDHSYNIFLTKVVELIPGDPPLHPNLWLFSGNGRHDFLTYQLVINPVQQQPPLEDIPGVSAYGSKQLAVMMDDLGASGYKMTKADGTVLFFNALDATAAPGKCTSIIDRNGNTTSLLYDGSHRLEQVIDTIGRPIIFAYYASPHDELIHTVTDFAGRTVTYTYFDAAATEGNDKDLETVTLPAVEIDAANEYDFPAEHAEFPNGTTWRYTYYKSTNNNIGDQLKTVEDPRAPGVARLTNVYDANKGYCISQTLADGGRWDYTYILDVDNDYIEKATINTRDGNVIVLRFNGHHQINSRSEYENKAPNPAMPSNVGNAAAPSIPAVNMPAGPTFITTNVFNASNVPKGLRRKSKTLPNGDKIDYRYNNDINFNILKAGNLTSRTRTPVGAAAGEEIREEWKYEFGLGPV